MQENDDLLGEVLPTETPWALVTGASKGIGRGIAIGLAKQGWNLAIHYHTDADGAQETQSLLKQVGAQDTMLLQADIGRSSEIASMFEEIDEAIDGIELLVNNAGVQTTAPFLEISESDWNRTLDVNLTGPFLCAQAAARRMNDGLGGSIVNIGSGASQKPFPGHAGYCASKAGLAMLTQVMAVELGPYGIRVNGVAPGCIAVERTQEENPDLEGTWRNLTPLRRLGTPVDIADAVCFLASRSSQFITGQTLTVDGGLWTQVPWPFTD